MAEKTLMTRLKLRYDSHENWLSADPVLLAGEVALSTVATKQEGTVNYVPSVLIKVGDGTHKYSELDFAYAKAADVVAAAKSEDALTAFISNVIANSGIATDEAMQALSNRVTTVEGLIGGTGVAEQISTAIANLKLAETYAALEHTHTKDEITDFAHEHAIADVTGLQDALDGLQVKGDYAAAEHGHEIADVDGLSDAIADAKQAGIDAQADVDALSAKVGEVAEGTTVVQMIADAQEAATYDDTELAGRVSELETLIGGDTPVAEQISTAIDNALKVDGAEKYALAEHTHEIDDVTGLADAIADAKKAGTDANAALEAYQGTNDTAVQKVADDLAAEIERATGVEGGLEDRIETMEAFWAAAQADGTDSNVVDTLKEIQEYIASDESGASAMAASIKQNADDIDALEGLVGGTEVSVQIQTAINNLDLPNTYDAKGAAADALTDAKEYADGLNTAMDTRVKAVEETSHTHDNKTVLDGISAEKVAAWDAAEQNAKDYADGLADNYDAAGSATQALADAKTYADAEVKELADGAVATNTAAIAALDALVGDTAVATQITNAIDEALKIDGVDKYALASALTAAIEQHNTDKTALEAEIAKKANDADLAAIAKTGNVNDLVQTDGDVLILDCGGAA